MQVLRPGAEVPEVVEVVPFRVGDVVSFRVPLAFDDGDWCCCDGDGTPLS